MPTGAPSAAGPRGGSAFAMLALGAVTALALGSMAAAANGHRFSLGAVTARLDVGITVLFVMAGYLLYLPLARAVTADTARPAARRSLRRLALRFLPAYWVVLLIAAFIYRQAQPMTALDLASYLTLTNIYAPDTFLGPIPLAWALATGAAFCVFLPLFAWCVARPSAEESRRVRHQWIGLAAMVLVAVVFRTWVVSLDAPQLTVLSRRAWLFNHLDTFAVGMALALAQVVRERHIEQGESSAWSAQVWWRISFAGAAVAVVAFVMLVALGLSRQALVFPAPQEWARHVLTLAIGAGLVIAVAAGSRGPWFAVPTLPWGLGRWPARLAYGVFLWHGLVITVYGSRHPDAAFNLSFLRMALFVIPIVVLLAALTWGLVQRPSLTYLDRRLPTFAAGMWGIGIAGLLWRLVSVLHITTVRPDGGDPFYYHIQAGLLSAGRGFSEPFRWTMDGTLEPTAIHPPLYSMYLSISSFLGADTYLAHKTLSIVAGVGVVVVIGLIARRLGGDWAGWIAAALAAFYPQFWIVDGILWSEGLFTLFIALTVWAAFAYSDRPSRWGAVWLGLAVSGAVLTRGEALILAPMLVAPLVFFGPYPLRRWRRSRAAKAEGSVASDETPPGEPMGSRPPWKERTLRLGIAALAVALPIVPWLARNMTAFEQPITLSSNSDEVLYYANCVDSYYGDFIGYWSFPCQERERQVVQEPRDESVRVKFWRDKGIDYAMSHKSRWPVVVAARIGRVLEVYRPAQGARILSIEGRPLGWTQFGQVMWWSMLPIAAVGAWLLRRRGRWAWPLWSQVVMVVAVSVLVYGHVRFRPPLDLAVIVFAAVALSAALRRGAARVLTTSAAAPILAARPAPAGQHLGDRHVDGQHLQDHGAEQPTDLDDAKPRTALGRWWGARPRLRTGVGVAIVVLAVLAPLRELLRRQGVPMEEGFMLAFPQRVLAGDVPNKDFLHLYGPGGLWALAAWYKVFGVNLAAERWFGLLQLTGIIGGVAALARAWGRRMMVIAGVACAVISLTAVGLVALAWNGGLALLVGSVVALRWALADDSDRTAPLVATGVLGGAALLFRPDLVLVVGLVGVVALWLAGDGRKRLWKAGASGMAVGSLILIQLALAGPGAAIKGMLIQPVFDLRAGRALPVPPSWGSIDGFAQRAAMIAPPSWPLPMAGPSQQVFLWFVGLLAATLLAVVTALVVARRSGWSAAAIRADRGALTTLLVAPLALGILPQAMQRADTTHLAWVGCIVIPLTPGLVFQLTRGWVRPRYRGALAVVLGGALVASMVIVAPIYTLRPYAERVVESASSPPPAQWSLARDGKNFWLGGTPITTAAQALAADLDALSEPGQRLFVGPSDLSKTPYSDAYWYYMFGDLTPATRYIEMDPGIADAADSGLADDLAGADWVILSHVWDSWDEANTSGDTGSNEPNEVLNARFCRYRSYGDSFELWARRPATGDCPAPQPPVPVSAPPARDAPVSN